MMVFKFKDRFTARTARAGLLFSGIGLLLVSPAIGDDATSCAPSCAPTCAPACAPACGTCTDCNACAKNYEDAEKKLSGEYNRLLGEAAACAPGCAESATSCDGSACEEDCGCGFKLQDLLCKADECGEKSPYEVAGWLDMGYQSDHDGSFCGNGPFLDDHEWKNFQVNQMYLYSQKVADGTKGWDWGYRADLIYGTDGNDAQAFGNNPGNWDFQNGFDHGIYEWAIPQAYAEVAHDNLSVKLGHFYTIVGYEVVAATGNFFYSKQVNFWNSEPFTHTGALATYKASDKLSVTGGWVAGWDTGFDQFNGGSQGIVGATYTASENTVLTYYNVFGNSGWRGDENVVQGVILTQKWAEKWSTAHQLDILSSNTGTDFNVDGVAGDSTGFINYLFYDVTDKVKAGTRVEWYKADATSYYTWTYGVNFKPMDNLTIRPEVRHMWAPGAQTGAPGTIANNVSGVYRANTVFGIDAVLTF